MDPLRLRSTITFAISKCGHLAYRKSDHLFWKSFGDSPRPNHPRIKLDPMESANEFLNAFSTDETGAKTFCFWMNSVSYISHRTIFGPSEASGINQPLRDSYFSHLRNLQPPEAWVVHFTCEDDYLDHSTWQSEEELESAGINVVHFQHSLGVSTISMAARRKNTDGEVQNDIQPHPWLARYFSEVFFVPLLTVLSLVVFCWIYPFRVSPVSMPTMTYMRP